MMNALFTQILNVAQPDALVKYDETFSAVLLILIIALALVVLGVFIYHRRVNLIQPNSVSMADEMAKPLEEILQANEDEVVQEETQEEVVEEEIVEEHVHEFVDGVCECGEKDPNYVPPHVHEFVDGVCECGEKDPNYVPEAHKVMFAEVNPEESALHTNNMSELITESISVEEAKEKIEDEVLDKLVVKANDLAKYKKAKKEKFIVNIDSISDKFNNGEVVNLESLKARNLLPKKCNYFKVLARGILDKKITVEANDFSKDAIKMILLTGGNVIKVQ